MKAVVLDTNVLVSALWSRNGTPARILDMVLHGKLKPCYDYRILQEYRFVLMRPKFQFLPKQVDALLDFIEKDGISVVPEPVDAVFPDETDRKFYEVAVFCNAVLITGNGKHFPPSPCVLTPAEFMMQMEP